jgi:hypothetical protein
MRDASRAAGAELVVMFVPFKSQVFLPIAIKAMPHDELVSALRYSLPDGRIDVAAMTANRLAQNRMMRRFCADSGIGSWIRPTRLPSGLVKGSTCTFPDDSHLNEAGHAVVAATLESALRLQRMRDSELLNAFALVGFRDDRSPFALTARLCAAVELPRPMAGAAELAGEAAACAARPGRRADSCRRAR